MRILIDALDPNPIDARQQTLGSRVARWFVFKPKIPIWGKF
jgi:hypothetical protein